MRRGLFNGICMCLLLFISISGECSPPRGLTLRLLPEVEVAGNEIYLADVVEVGDLDPHLIATLSLIQLGHAPLPGKTREVEAGYVRNRLLQAGFKAEDFSLDGARTIVVRGMGRPLSGEKLLEMAEGFIVENLGISRDDVEIIPLSLPFNLLIPEKGRLQFVLPSGGRLLGTVLLPVEVWREGSVIGREMMRLRVSARQRILVATRELSAGEIIGEGDFRLEEREISMVQGTLAVDPSAVMGKRLKGPLKAGDPFTLEILSIPPAVRRGERVIIIARAGAVEVEAPGIAMKDGMMGEVIGVENTSSGRRLNGVVLGPGRVEVLLP